MSVPAHQIGKSHSETLLAFQHFMIIRHRVAKQPILTDLHYYHFEFNLE